MKGTAHKYVCTICGSDDVCTDAWARWDPATQQNVLHSSYDDEFCQNCESACSTEEFALKGDELIQVLRERQQYQIEAHGPQLLKQLKTLTRQLEAWVEIADDEDQREADHQAIADARALIAQLEPNQEA